MASSSQSSFQLLKIRNDFSGLVAASFEVRISSSASKSSSVQNLYGAFDLSPSLSKFASILCVSSDTACSLNLGVR